MMCHRKGNCENSLDCWSFTASAIEQSELILLNNTHISIIFINNHNFDLIAFEFVHSRE